MSIVEFKDVTCVYTTGDHELKALDDVNFTLDEEKCHCLWDLWWQERIRKLIWSRL